MLRATAMELQLGGDDASSDEDSAAHNPLLPAARAESRRQGSMVQPKAEAKPKVHPKIEPKIEPKRGRKRAQTEPDDKPARNEDGWLSGPDEPGASRKRPKQGDAVRVWFRHSDLHIAAAPAGSTGRSAASTATHFTCAMTPTEKCGRKLRS